MVDLSFGGQNIKLGKCFGTCKCLVCKRNKKGHYKVIKQQKREGYKVMKQQERESYKATKQTIDLFTKKNYNIYMDTLMELIDSKQLTEPQASMQYWSDYGKLENFFEV